MVLKDAALTLPLVKRQAVQFLNPHPRSGPLPGIALQPERARGNQQLAPGGATFCL